MSAVIGKETITFELLRGKGASLRKSADHQEAGSSMQEPACAAPKRRRYLEFLCSSFVGEVKKGKVTIVYYVTEVLNRV